MSGIQSMLNPAGPQAERIADLWWFFLAVTAVVYIAVVAALIAAIVRGRRRARVRTDEPFTMATDTEDRKAHPYVIGATVATVVLLFVLLTSSVLTGRAIAGLNLDQPLTISVIGHQWWWQVEYRDPIPQNSIVTANEIHVPTGRPILLKATSTDVIHSFWIPNVHGKKDLIPGHTTMTTFRVDKPGIYRGQCAEYCGLQHAHMGLLLIAETPEAYSRWLNKQRAGSVLPHKPEQIRGQQVFLNAPCANCHTIRGIGAYGQTGPDLTHLASRRTLAATTIPNVRGHLAGWILDSGSIKPGNRMPPIDLAPEDLHALLAYLESLE